MELLKLWEQKKENRRIVNWLYELGSELRLGELPQFKKYKNKYVTRDVSMREKQDILDIELCHKHFCGDYYLKDGEHCVDNVQSRYRCGHRLCPICETIKARQEYTRLTWKMNKIKDDYRFFFLTLTLPNENKVFRDKIDIMNECSNNLFLYIQGKEKKAYRVSGFYSTWEVTYEEKDLKGKDRGFHPHLHTIIAIPKEYVKECQVTRVKKQIKKLVLNAGHRDFITSNYDLVDKYKKLIAIKYKGLYNDKSYIHVDFRECYNIENDVRELCKYFIDFTKLPNLETFIMYAQSIYGVKRKKKRGCFKWTEQDELDWKSFIDELHSEQRSIAQNKNSIEVVFTFNSDLSKINYETVLDYLRQGHIYTIKYDDLISTKKIE